MRMESAVCCCCCCCWTTGLRIGWPGRFIFDRGAPTIKTANAGALLYTLLHKMVSHVHKIINIWTHTIVLSVGCCCCCFHTIGLGGFLTVAGALLITFQHKHASRQEERKKQLRTQPYIISKYKKSATAAMQKATQSTRRRHKTTVRQPM